MFNDSNPNEKGRWRPPTDDEIRKRAFELYLERERECGGAIDDWLEAEAELWLRRTVSASLCLRCANLRTPYTECASASSGQCSDETPSAPKHD
jgi:Protein of unknown function (DUF2934)